MVKGYQKRVVFMKNTGSEFFDEAYFVVADAHAEGDGADMINEANRIIDEAAGFGKKRRGGGLFPLAISFLLGSFVTALSVLIYSAAV